MEAIKTIASHGIQSTVVVVECHIVNGLPATVVVGLAHRSVVEAKERLRSAFQAAGLRYPRKRIIVNLIPADIPKAGASLDLALAVSIMRATDQLPLPIGADHCFIGEIGLSGQLLPSVGIVGKLMAGKAAGLRYFYVPASNLLQASLVPHITLIPLLHLNDLVGHAHQIQPITPVQTGTGQASLRATPSVNPFSSIRGLDGAKRLLQIAAAGRHNVLLQGPPGTGKSLLAAALPGLLPPPNHQELLAITQLHSSNNQALDYIHQIRPLQAPHHSASVRELLGTASHPGAISLAHCGVLLLDELSEFSRAAVEALRQPLEDHFINHRSSRMPADFQLIATANPCPCGYYGTQKPCQCAPYQVQRYRYKLSGPFIDRMDLYLSVTDVEHQTLLSEKHQNKQDLAVLDTVQAAHRRQFERYGCRAHNSRVSAAQLSAHLQLDQSSRQLLEQAASQFNLSARAYIRVAAVARTIADLSDSEPVTTEHVAEALQYRPQLQTAGSV